MNAKVWYVAAGRKKVGPLTANRVMQRLAAGKLPSGALAWREGMHAWQPVHEIDELGREPTLLDVAVDASASTEAQGGRAPSSKGGRRRYATDGVARRKKAARASRSEDAAPARRSSTSTAATNVGEGFEPPHRIERRDVWRAYGLGLDRHRAVLVVATVLAAGLAGGLGLGLGKLLAGVHALLALPCVLVAALAVHALGALGLGALSYHSRRLLAYETPPPLGEAVRFALSRASGLVVTPLVLAVAWLVPLLALGLLTLLVKIPYLGPVGTGLAFGAHIALSGLTLFLVLSAGVASAFGPVIVAFEGTGVRGTLAALFAFVKGALVRVFLWAFWPTSALGPFTFGVLLVGAVVLALPLTLLYGAAGGPDLIAWLSLGGEPPVAGLTAGAIPLVLWLGACGAGLLALPVSVSNAMLSLLYLGGRPGNDERISRDDFLEARARRAGEEG